MGVAERIKICRLLELMESQKKYCREVGMADLSRLVERTPEENGKRKASEGSDVIC